MYMRQILRLCKYSFPKRAVSSYSKMKNHLIDTNLTLLTNAYMEGVTAVLPHLLVPKAIRRENSLLFIGNESHALNHNVYVVGFGKAVISMVKPIEHLLREGDGTSHVVRGVVSVPYNIVHSIKDVSLLPEPTSVVEIIDGAANNIPDDDAHGAAQRIVSLLGTLSETDLVLLLVSGGGSALLPMPTPPITMVEKSSVVRQLGQAGANIVELNTVRKALSDVKGGKLADKTKAKMIALMLSDVIDSRFDIIASGPTLPNVDNPADAVSIIAKYNISTPPSVRQVLSNQSRSYRRQVSNFGFEGVTNIIMGDNTVALDAARRYVEQHSQGTYESIVATARLTGVAAEVGRCMAQLCKHIADGYDNLNTGGIPSSLLSTLCVSDSAVLLECIMRCWEQRKPVCLLFGGETTVHVRGRGRGGRNQEMVLAASICLDELLGCAEFRGAIFFLSAGTDGIDGPTDAAGAHTYWTAGRSVCSVAASQFLSPAQYLHNNDSYGFFSRLSEGKHLLRPGHTTTNVMDLQLLCVRPHLE